MVGSKTWEVILWITVLLNVSSLIMNFIVGHWVWVAIAIFVLLVLMPWNFRIHNLEKEARRLAREQMEATDVP